MYPIIIFALSDQKTCKYYYCIYNKFMFTKCSTKDVSWFKHFFNFDSNHYLVNIPAYETLNLQDFLLLLEMLILRGKYKRQARIGFNRLLIYGKRISVKLDTIPITIKWPFNKYIYSSYIFFYILVYHILNRPVRTLKSNCVVKLNAKLLSNSWSQLIKTQLFEYIDLIVDMCPSYLHLN
jgi:hypothetical protein